MHFSSPTPVWYCEVWGEGENGSGGNTKHEHSEHDVEKQKHDSTDEDPIILSNHIENKTKNEVETSSKSSSRSYGHGMKR